MAYTETAWTIETLLERAVARHAASATLLAATLGVTPQVVSQWRTGRTLPALSRDEALAMAAAVPLAEVQQVLFAAYRSAAAMRLERQLRRGQALARTIPVRLPGHEPGGSGRTDPPRRPPAAVRAAA